MGIADDVAKQKEVVAAAPLCKVGQVLASLAEGEDSTAIEYAIRRTRLEATLPQNKRVFTASFIHRLLNDNGFTIGATTVKDHLSRKCTCDAS